MKWYNWLLYNVFVGFVCYAVGGSVYEYLHCKSGIMGVDFPHYVCVEINTAKEVKNDN